MWVVTAQVNDYNQHGDYFVAVYRDKPTAEQLKSLLLLSDTTIHHILKGGGRQPYEDEWFELFEVSEGHRYY